MNANGVQQQLDRRGFLKSAAGAGAALTLGPAALGASRQGDDVEPLRVALIGGGIQGEVLVNACRQIPGVRFQAVCDLWEAYHLRRISRILQRYGHPGMPYTDYEAMLNKEKNLQAAIIATPDFWHARHALACLNAGLHVYCETPMAHTAADARRMVEAARRGGKFLQIGLQRRSNPQYRFCYDKLWQEYKLLGRIVAVNGQWNRAFHSLMGWPRNAALDPDTLKRHGYESMDHFRNWRWYRDLSGGPLADLGAQQIDIYNWFLGARPRAVLASGRRNYYETETRQRYDTVMAVYEYEAPQGPVTASYQILLANRHDGYFEKFLGDRGTLLISQRSDRTRVYPELMGSDAASWLTCLQKGDLKAPKEWRDLLERQHRSANQFADLFRVNESEPMVEQLSCEVPVKTYLPLHQPHLENFFDAIRGKAQLTCPAEVGYQATVAVLKANEAAEAGRRLEFKPEEFVV
jgi:predicted dehydrogenase